MNLIDLETPENAETRFTEFLDQVRDRFEMDHVAYAGMNPVDRSIHGHVTYSDDWKAHYADLGYQRIDPTLLKTRRSIAPVDWRRLERDASFKAVFSDAREFGISDQGLTIPVRGPFGEIGLFSVTRDCSDDEWKKLKRSAITGLQSVAVHMHDMVIQSSELSRVLHYSALSQRELEILQWTAAGKSQQDVADILSISHRTVEVHLRSARSKLYALTTPQAVGRAIGMGLIYPE